MNQRIHNLMNSDVYLKSLDKLVAWSAFLYPLTALPQLYEIWINKNINGVSLLSWSLFLVFTLLLLLHSIARNDKNLIIMWLSWIVVYIGIIGGILLQG
ncbi:hypothetical protein J4418_03930 [Candidatus Woesearchaeota archaeon]|nr:hypothetical protein [Candidatus Woesearchaeota archaeon]